MSGAVKSLLAIGVAIAGLIAAERFAIRRWAQNPDPLRGKPAVFPSPGTVRTVIMDDGARINTVSSGSGPTVVMVHGLSGNRHHWGPIGSRLIERGFRVVAVEQRGHGDSSVGTDGFSVERQAKDLAAVYRELELTETILVGHSMGGMAAMVMAVLEPELARQRVNHCVLISTAGTMKTWDRQLGAKLASARVVDNMPKGVRVRVGAALVAFGEKPSLHMIDEAIKAISAMNGAELAGSAAGLGTHDVIEFLPGVTTPTLVICGTKDRMTPARDSRLLAETMPNARLKLIQGAGHMVIFERPDELADLIAACR